MAIYRPTARAQRAEGDGDRENGALAPVRRRALAERTNRAVGSSVVAVHTPTMTDVLPVSNPDIETRSGRLKHATTGAARLLAKVLVNSIAAALVLVLMSSVLSQVNAMLSAMLSRLPTTQEFVTVTSFFAFAFATGAAFVMDSVALTSSRFVEAPTQFQSIASCARRLMRHSWRSWVVLGIIEAGATYVAGASTVANLTQWKTQLYLLIVCGHVFHACLEVAKRFIYQTQTVEGCVRGHKNLAPYWRRVMRTFLTNPVLSVLFLLIGIYVHVASTVMHDPPPMALLAFTIFSMAFKILVQEAAKHTVMRCDGVNPRSILMAVLPRTVMIDTQLRIAMLRFQQTSPSVVLTSQSLVLLLLAVFELMLRIGKLILMRWEIRGHHRRRPRYRSTARGVHVLAAVPGKEVVMNLQSWRDRRLYYQAAETLADMYAEYTAIVCSTAFQVFLDRGDHYFKGQQRSSLSMGTLVFQVVLEVVVDFCCCVIETLADVPAIQSSQLSGYVIALLVDQSVGTMMVCALGYITK